jgi:hypothetical protein
MVLVADHHDIQIGRNPAFEMLGEGDTGKPATADDDPPPRKSSNHTWKRLFSLPGPRRCLCLVLGRVCDQNRVGWM